MSGSRPNGGRARVRAYRPKLEGQLETRVVMSSVATSVHQQLSVSAYILKHSNARTAYLLQHPPHLSHNPPIQGKVRRRSGVAATQTARGGQNVEVNDNGTHFMISLSYTSNTLATNTSEGELGQGGNSTPTTASELVSQATSTYPQPIGTVRAYPMPNHEVGIIVDGSTQNTELTINPLGEAQKKGYAKSYAYGQANLGHILNIGQLTVNSGEIADIEGFQDATLSGPLVVSGTTAIDRIALDAILPGGSITTGGDLQTLDVLNGITLSGTNITIGRDLNLLNIGGNVDLSDGSQFNIGRNLGLVSQPPKGTGTGSNVLALNYTSVSNSIISVTIPAVGAFIQGNVTVDPGSSFNIGATAQGDIFNTMFVSGTVTAGFVPQVITPTSTTVGSLSLLTINGQPASLLQTELSEFAPSGSSTADEHYVTAIGGFA